MSNPQSDIYDSAEENTDVPALVKKQIIQLSCLRRRCEEEKGMVKEEMKHSIDFIKHQVAVLDNHVSGLDLSNLGCHHA